MCSLETLARLLVLQLVMVTACGAERNIPLRANVEQVQSQWRCHKPQARLVYMSAEVEDFDADAMYFPPAVVLHRCDKSVGCCTRPGYTCAPAKTEDVTVQFRVFSVNKMHTIEEFSFVNHTSCECESSDYAETIIKDSANSIRLSTLF